MLKRLTKILLTSLLLLFVLVFLFLIFERIRGQISLARYKRELAAKGETLDVKNLISVPKPGIENGAGDFCGSCL
jgi:hypothetical protein